MPGSCIRGRVNNFFGEEMPTMTAETCRLSVASTSDDAEALDRHCAAAAELVDRVLAKYPRERALQLAAAGNADHAVVVRTQLAPRLVVQVSLVSPGGDEIEIGRLGPQADG